MTSDHQPDVIISTPVFLVGKVQAGHERPFVNLAMSAVHNSPRNPAISRLPSRPGRVSLPTSYAETPPNSYSHHVSQILIGGAAIIGGIFAGTWFYMSTKQARKASREPGEKGSLPSC